VQPITVTPIATIHSPRVDRTDVDWGAVESTIELDPARFTAESLLGLNDFSHLEIVYFMHGIPENAVTTSARHPRENPQWPRVGIFAQRGAKRPNRIGVSRCKLISLNGTSIRVRGLDAIDGSPVLDIKPYMREFGPIGEIQQPDWATEVMQRYYDER
jgi:tRNA-Thr(GGU) m(6)t(6)A37 methyltransferase TsaA